jgi:Holliday junction DNA helicase RuvB
MPEILLAHTCKKCECTYYSDGETNARGFCPTCQISHRDIKSQEVTIVPSLLDVSQLGGSSEAQEYRPSSWSEYKGQESAKEKVSSYIAGCKKFGEVYPHTFISAPSGMGKTLFASILAVELGKKIIFTTGGELKSEQIFIDKLVESEGGVIFIDEANRLPKRVGFFILPLMEQFAIQGKAIKKFTLIMATTHKGDISKDLDALIQRCDNISLEPYKDGELLEIVSQYHKKQYPTIQIPDSVMMDMIKSSRNTPRNAKNFVRAYAYNSDWNKIKQYNNIVKDGLNSTDIKALQYLQTSKGAGMSAIANHLRVKSQTYLWEIEPYLMVKDFIKIENKRMITNAGIEFLKEL